MKYKSFKEFYWKSAIFKIGLPWGFLTGLLLVIIQDDEILKYFLSTKVILQILFFVIVGGLLMAYGTGKSLWRISKKKEEES
jgi:hypothetical protein